MSGWLLITVSSISLVSASLLSFLTPPLPSPVSLILLIPALAMTCLNLQLHMIETGGRADNSGMTAGDLLRAERQRPGSTFGEMITDCIREGKIVPMEVTVKVGPA